MIKKLVIGVVIVSYGHERYLPNLASSLRKQMQSGDKIVVVDNHSNRKGYDLASKDKAVNFAIKADNNGFAAGCNIGASKILDSVDILFFINPDTKPGNNVIDTIRQADYSYYAGVMPLLVLEDKTVNSIGNVIHISGLSWSDGLGKPSTDFTKDQDISILSGACMAISTDWWKKIGGISESYFLYYEDIEFCTSILLQGGKMGLLPAAQIEHDYDYEKGSYKWLYLERNRPLYILRTWPLSVIILLSLQLFFVGIGLWLIAILQGRFKLKVKSFVMTLRALPSTIKDRHFIQRNRSITSYEFFSKLSYRLDSPMLGSLGSNPLINGIYKIYYNLCLYILKLIS